jgi:hydroxyacylglutathione hydrolase
MRILPKLALAASGQIGLSARWDCHVWAVRAPAGVVLIDAGSGYGPAALDDRVAEAFPEAAVRAVLLTHSHADHCGGAARLRRRYGCAVIVPAVSRTAIETGDELASGLAAARASGSYPEDLRLEPCPVDSTFRHGEAIDIAGQRFQAIQVRGHAPDSFCLFAEIDGLRVLFSGDVVFYGGVLGVINAPGSGMGGYLEDLPRLADLRIDALLAGHGLFTLAHGQRHVDAAIAQCRSGFLPRMIGQWDLVF